MESGVERRICEEIGVLLEGYQATLSRQLEVFSAKQEIVLLRVQSMLDSGFEPFSPGGEWDLVKLDDVLVSEAATESVKGNFAEPPSPHDANSRRTHSAASGDSEGMIPGLDTCSNAPPDAFSRANTANSSEVASPMPRQTSVEACEDFARELQAEQEAVDSTPNIKRINSNEMLTNTSDPLSNLRTRAAYMCPSRTEAELNRSFNHDDEIPNNDSGWSYNRTSVHGRRASSLAGGAWESLRHWRFQQFLDRFRERGCWGYFRSMVSSVVSSHYFDIVSGTIILGNAIVMGMETDLVAKTGESAQVYTHLTLAFNIWYIVELLMRFIKAGWGLFFGRDWRWGWFDLVLLMTSIGDMIAESASLTGLQAGRTVRTIRLFRVARVLRVVRMLRYVREFRKIVFSLATSVQTLLWSMLLMVFVMFCFGVFFTQSATDFVRISEEPHYDEEDLNASFGSLLRSMYSLYLAITAGRGWGELSDLLEGVHPAVMAIFIIYVSVSIFGLMNVVTAVFVESAMASSQHYKDLLVQEKMLMDQTRVRHMKEIFRVIDIDGSGSISMEEMQAFVQNPELDLQSYFEALDINATDTVTLFKLLDHDQSGEVDIDEFCDGCMRLRGMARSFDLHTMRYEEQRHQKRMVKFMQHVMRSMRKLIEEKRFVSDAITNMSNRIEVVHKILGKSMLVARSSVPALTSAAVRNPSGGNGNGIRTSSRSRTMPAQVAAAALPRAEVPVLSRVIVAARVSAAGVAKEPPKPPPPPRWAGGDEDGDGGLDDRTWPSGQC